MAGKWRFPHGRKMEISRQTLQMSSQMTTNATPALQRHICQLLITLYSGGNHQLKTLSHVSIIVVQRSGFSWESFLGYIFLSKADIFGQDLATGGWWGPERPRACFPQTISQRSPGKTLSADLLIGGTGHLTALQSVATHFEML